MQRMLVLTFQRHKLHGPFLQLTEQMTSQQLHVKNPTSIQQLKDAQMLSNHQGAGPPPNNKPKETAINQQLL